MVSQEALEKLSKQKDPLLQECYSALEKLLLSPYLETYLTIYRQLEDFNLQLTLTGELKKRVIGNDILGNVISVDWQQGKLDLFADKEDKSFDRSFKYMLEAPELLMSLEKLRNLMLPADQKKVSDLKKAHKVSGVAA